MGKWRADTLGCCDDCTSCWASYLCPFITVAQLYERVLRSGTCTFIALAILFTGIGGSAALYYSSIQYGATFIYALFFGPFSALSIILVVKIRLAIRSRDKIEPSEGCTNCTCFGANCEDICCASWCGPCVTCQMMRHEGMTGDDYDLASSTGMKEDYPYKWATPAGATESSPPGAPPGKWRSGIFECCNLKGLCLLPFACVWLPISQLYEKVLQRGTCTLVAALGSLMPMSVVVFLVKIRAAIRSRDKIEPSECCKDCTCQGANCEDICCACWCAPCVTSQMMLHEGIEEGQYDPTSSTGTKETYPYSYVSVDAPAGTGNRGQLGCVRTLSIVLIVCGVLALPLPAGIVAIDLGRRGLTLKRGGCPCDSQCGPKERCFLIEAIILDILAPICIGVGVGILFGAASQNTWGSGYGCQMYNYYGGCDRYGYTNPPDMDYETQAGLMSWSFFLIGAQALLFFPAVIASVLACKIQRRPLQQMDGVEGGRGGGVTRPSEIQRVHM
jgi:Cys-rich protein (TIGR01571 family)